MTFSDDFGGRDLSWGSGQAGPLRMPVQYEYEPGRRVINLADPRLNHILLTNRPQCASLNEYSRATAIPVELVLELFAPALDDQTLALETAGDELFVLTAPLGRPVKPQCADVAPNLWEHLRRHAGPEKSHDLWRLYRALERGGWVPEAQTERIGEGLSRLGDTPHLGVYVGQRVVPLLVFPLLDALSSEQGLLTDYEQAGAAMAGIICAEGSLDATTTAVRRWLLAHKGWLAYMSVLVLEAPRFSPVLLSSSDGAVVPVAITQMGLQQHTGTGSSAT